MREVAEALQAGRLEQTCHACGRWEAASKYCSFCGGTITPDEWYANGDTAERRARLPATAPATVPPEYRDAIHWPATWGPFPRQRPARQPQTPQSADIGLWPDTGTRAPHAVAVPQPV